MKNASICLLAAGMVAHWNPAAAMTQCESTVVVTLPSNLTDFVAEDISADGSTVVGTGTLLSNLRRAVRWTEPLGFEIMPLTGNSTGFGLACSADGSTVVGYRSLAVGGVYTERPARWRQGQPLEEIFELSGEGGGGHAEVISDDGTYIAGYRSVGTGRQPFRWSEAGGLELLSPFPGSSAHVRGISADGSVVVGVVTPAGAEDLAFRWTEAGGFQSLGSVNGLPSTCSGISGNGRVIIGQNSSTQSGGLFTWTETGGLVDRGDDFPDGAMTDLTGDGSMIVGRARAVSSVAPAAWTHATGIVSIGYPLPGSGTVLAVSSGGDTTLMSFGSQDTAFALVRRSLLGPVYCDQAVANSTGCVGSIRAAGSTLVTSNSLQLVAGDLPTSTFGFFLVGPQLAEVFQPIGSAGVLCLGGSIGRFVGPGEVQNSGSSGSFALDVDLTQLPQPSGPVTGLPGDTWMFQAWHRDTGLVPTSNFTSAMAVTLR